MESNPVDGQLTALVAGFLQLEPGQLSADSAAGDFPQWDSFAHANLIMEVERHFRVTFDVEDVLEMVSLGDIAAVLRRMSASASPAG
jgi:acyl carrier protein